MPTDPVRQTNALSPSTVTGECNPTSFYVSSPAMCRYQSGRRTPCGAPLPHHRAYSPYSAVSNSWQRGCPRQGSLLFKRRERLRLRARTRSGSAFAGCAEAQRRPPSLIEQALGSAPPCCRFTLIELAPDCSLAAEFGPSPVGTLPATTASADSSAPVGRRCRRPTPDRPEKRGGLPG